MGKWRDKFLRDNITKDVGDLKNQTKIKQANMNISKILRDQKDKEKCQKAKKDIQRMLKNN